MYTLLADTLTPWQDSGIFFVRSVFGILGTVIVSSKAQEWCVSSDPQKIGNLIAEIDEELGVVNRAQLKNEVVSLESVSDHYKDCKSKAEKLLADLKRWRKVSAVVFYVLVYACFACTVFLLCSGYDRVWGAWSLLLVLPLIAARVGSSCYYRAKDASADEYLKDFRQKRLRYQKEYVESETHPVKALETFRDS